ncbi:mediator of RNA polymerase II transcription subunit 22 isoform X3 [Mirounga leonina]|uniref:mediator of RNA polymerase II transcription subunit 22 isoform X3 n=1 Tax=Mirounga leonina TaxID=9715 RepID=UPI00156BF2D8|nr:mediator of RNA polymerase II transcription subunit 22 isoform X3 [Mirounga leonina]
MAQQRALPQSKETLLQSYNKRLKDDVKSIMDNFTEIIKTAKIEDETQVSRATQGEQDNYEMHVRAANIFLILNDFPSVNEAIDQRNQQLRALQEECDRKLIALRDEISIDLYELEEEYYSSRNNLYLTLTTEKGIKTNGSPCGENPGVDQTRWWGFECLQFPNTQAARSLHHRCYALLGWATAPVGK